MVKSRAEELLERREALPPQISPAMAKGISQYRKRTLEAEMDQGSFREYGVVPRITGGDGPTQAGIVSSSSSGSNIYKAAQSTQAGPGLQGAAGSAGVSFRGAGGTVKQVPELYSPLWLDSNLNLPRDRATVNAWCRSFFALNPIVQNAINLHSTYPISKLNIKSKNRKVEKFFAAMVEELELMSVCTQIAQEFWTLGEVFPFADWDESAAKWSRIIIQNPDYVVVNRSVVASEPIISLRPDENLRRLVFSNRPADIQQRNQLGSNIVEHVKKGQNIPLNNFYVSHLARRISPYEIRGTGLIVSCFRALMLFDKMYESKYVQASSLINPTTLVKIGNQEFRPTPTDLQAWRDVFESAESDKNFKIFTHDAVTIERIGFAQGIYDISADLDRLIKLIYIGLMVPSVLMDGSDTTYATGSVALDSLRQRYIAFREMLAHWLKRKIFAPVSKLNDFYEYVDGEKVLIVPEIDWNHMSLFDMADYIQNLSNLTGGGDPAQKRVSLQTLYRSLGLEYEDETRKMRFEDIQDTIRRKELQALESHSLNELRALSPSDEIEEREPVAGAEDSEPPVPGSPGAPPLGGGMSLPNIGGPPSKPIGAGGPKPPRTGPPGNVGITPGGIPKPSPPT